MSPKIMCQQRQQLENELTRAGNEKRGAERIIGVNPNPEEQRLLEETRGAYNNKLREINEHDAAIGHSGCGCIS